MHNLRKKTIRENKTKYQPFTYFSNRKLLADSDWDWSASISDADEILSVETLSPSEDQLSENSISSILPRRKRLVERKSRQ